MTKYRTLLWDIDGTVLNFAAAEAAALRALFPRHGLGECSDEQIARYSAINVRYWEALERGEMTKPEILVGRFREFFEVEHLDATKAEAFNADYQLALGDTVVFNDDAKTILLQEKERFRILAVTNGTEAAQRKKLAVSGLDAVFDGVYISELIGTEKPGRDFFRYVFEQEGITDTAGVLIIGDSLTSDIRGGINAGIDTCWYNPKGRPADAATVPTYCIKDLHELEPILA